MAQAQVSKESVSTGAAGKKKKIILWSSIGGAVALLATGLLIWLLGGDSDDDALPPGSPPKFASGVVMVVDVIQDVQVLSGSTDGSKPRPASKGEALGPSTRITTGKDSSAVLLFTNGAVARLAADSQIIVKDFHQEGFLAAPTLLRDLKAEPSVSKLRLDLDFGDLVMEVKKLKKESSLNIHSSLGIAGIRGTKFRLSAKEETVFLSVLEGLVDFDGPDAKVAVAGGKALEAIKSGDSPVAVKQVALPPSSAAEIRLALSQALQATATATLDDLQKAAANRTKFESKDQLSSDDPVKGIEEKLKTRNNLPNLTVEWRQQNKHLVIKTGAYSGLHDLSPLAETLLPIEYLDFSRQHDLTNASLDSLSKLKLKTLLLAGSQIDDLSALQGMPLEKLFINFFGDKYFPKCKVSDLSPLKGMPLKELSLDGCAVSSLEPLRGMPLERLSMRDAASVADLSPLKDAATLKYLSASGTAILSLEALAMLRLDELYVDKTQVSSLEPLKDMTLVTLSGDETKVSSMSPLKGDRLVNLSLQATSLDSLSPLSNMPNLGKCLFADSKVKDFAPLAACKQLSYVSITDPRMAQNLDVLRDLPLAWISMKPSKPYVHTNVSSADFWKWMADPSLKLVPHSWDKLIIAPSPEGVEPPPPNKAVTSSFMGVESEAVRTAYVIDFSASMRGKDLVMRSELEAAINCLPPTAEVCLIFFSGPSWLAGEDAKAISDKWQGDNTKGFNPKPGYKPKKPVWIPVTPANRSKLSKAISDTPLVFGTVWDNSFRWALTLLDPKPDVIFFMTDGSANRKGMDIIRQHHGSTKINTISYLAPAQAKISLKEIAKMTGGEFRSIDAAQIKQLEMKLKKKQ